jgi:hypothetical protein
MSAAFANLVGSCMGAAAHLGTVWAVLAGCGIAAAIVFASERGAR